MLMPNRNGSSDSYRYGFQGQEKDDEIKGDGNSYTAQFWQYDHRVSRRWEKDPVVKLHESPYAVFANNPIWFRDRNGADTLWTNNKGIVTNKITSEGKNVLLRYNGTYELEGITYIKYAKTIFHSDRDTKRLSDFSIGDKALYFVSEGNINHILMGSEIEPMTFSDRFKYARKESVGGSMDFPIILISDFGLMDDLMEAVSSHDFEKPYNMGPFIMFNNHLENTDNHSIDRAYNIFDAGQFLWGKAMQRLGFSMGSALFYANLNEWSTLGDSIDDQQAIRWGYMYRISTDKSIFHEVVNGIVNFDYETLKDDKEKENDTED